MSQPNHAWTNWPTGRGTLPLVEPKPRAPLGRTLAPTYWLKVSYIEVKK